MAKKVRKFAEGGSTDRYQAKYDRKIADIESDFKKAQAKGKNADIAKAKYEQRMADAKDDLAKWRGDDRSQTRKLEKAAETNLSLTRRYGAPAANKPIETQGELKPKMKDTSSLLKGVATKPAAKAATKPAAKAAAKPAESFLGKYWTGNPSGYSKDKQKKTTGVSLAEAAAAQLKAGRSNVPAKPTTSTDRDNTREGRRARMAAVFGFGPESDARAAKAAEAMKASRERQMAGYKPLFLTGDAAREANKGTIGGMKKGGKVAGKATKAGKAMVKKSADTMGRAMVKKFAKGGSVDGCAVRGKTRAPMKKGK